MYSVLFTVDVRLMLPVDFTIYGFSQVEEAIQAAVRERSDNDLCLIQEHVGKTNRTTYDRLTALRQQFR